MQAPLKRAIEGANAKGMRVIEAGDDGLCRVQCRAPDCLWQTPRDVVIRRYAGDPHGCIRCEARNN